MKVKANQLKAGTTLMSGEIVEIAKPATMWNGRTQGIYVRLRNPKTGNDRTAVYGKHSTIHCKDD